MRPQIIEGIKGRAEAFTQKCTESEGSSVDVYVRHAF
jgi:hypothetical protein